MQALGSALLFLRLSWLLVLFLRLKSNGSSTSAAGKGFIHIRVRHGLLA